MNKLLGAAFVAITLSLAANTAFADEIVRETRSIDAKVNKVKVGGVADLVLRQGATPSLVVSGERPFVSRVTTDQRGDTLQIDTERSSSIHIGRDNHKIRVELTMPNLTEFVSQGVGASTVTGFSGETIQLALDGAGTVNVDSRYRHVDARLGGVGAFTLDANQAERVELSLRGAGRMTVKGQSKLLRAKMAGVGSLEAQELRSDTVDLDMSGLGSASVYAKDTANVSLNGLGSATVYGNPASRNGTANGLGKINWK